MTRVSLRRWTDGGTAGGFASSGRALFGGRDHEDDSTRTRGVGDRRGLTLIESIVVIGILGILLALTLPAVQAARESARSMQCVSNMRQIGIALHGYANDHQMFPNSRLVDRRGVGNISQWAEHVRILPYLEQVALYNSINHEFMSLEWALHPSLENRSVRNCRLAIYLCPSDGEAHHLNSYRFNRGRYNVARTTSPFDGPFSIGVLPSQSTITDGLTRTAFVSERISGDFEPDSSDRSRNIKEPVIKSTFKVIDSDLQFIPYCLNSRPDSWEHRSGQYWFYSGIVNSYYNHNGQPNDRRPSCSLVPMKDYGPGGLSPPRSFHGGLVHVMFGDGHIESVKDSIDPQAWAALGTYNLGD
ncbi:MAG: DUF1559 domain-containing protein [Isosphaeraceae bacterium]|nr:DUF1559 domain-containing protein [Isosphaeraceae bacterium]